MRNLPSQVLPPIIQKADPDADPMMTLVLSSDIAEPAHVTEIADKQIKRAIETVDGVGEVTMRRRRPRGPHRRRRRKAERVRADDRRGPRRGADRRTSKCPAASIEQGKSEIGLRTLGRIEPPTSSTTSSWRRSNGTPIRVSDIGHAEDGDDAGGDGRVPRRWQAARCSSTVRRASGENTIKVDRGVKARLRPLQQALPKDVSLTG